MHLLIPLIEPAEARSLSIYDRLQEQRAEIIAIAAKHGAYNVRVFGSVARNEADSASDLDLLVDMEPERSLLVQAGLIKTINAKK